MRRAEARSTRRVLPTPRRSLATRVIGLARQARGSKNSAALGENRILESGCFVTSCSKSLIGGRLHRFFIAADTVKRRFLFQYSPFPEFRVVFDTHARGALQNAHAKSAIAMSCSRIACIKLSKNEHPFDISILGRFQCRSAGAFQIFLWLSRGLRTWLLALAPPGPTRSLLSPA
jgi:hypothetical protein